MNKKQKAQTLSLIIPVYNEENYLGNCLESIAAQTVKPLEVIVVDNNSTDRTVEIAKKFRFVKIIKEKRQHQSYAQYAGFEAAQGDILGRIDADTILPKDWIKRTLTAFSNQPSAVGLTGSGIAYDIVLQRFGRFIHGLYYRIASTFAGHNLMWGSNCAFRKSAWQLIKDDLILRPDIWEDYDLAFCLAKHGKLGSMPDNQVLISYRAIHRPVLQQFRYQFRSVRTFALRRNSLVAAGFALAWYTMLLLVPIVVVDYYILRPVRNIYLVRMLLARLAAHG